jgi:hypothetical protein
MSNIDLTTKDDQLISLSASIESPNNKINLKSHGNLITNEKES